MYFNHMVVVFPTSFQLMQETRISRKEKREKSSPVQSEEVFIPSYNDFTNFCQNSPEKMTSHVTIRKRLCEAENDLELEIAEAQCLFTRPFQTDFYQKGGGTD